MLLTIENSGEQDNELSKEWLVNTDTGEISSELAICVFLLSSGNIPLSSTLTVK